MERSIRFNSSELDVSVIELSELILQRPLAKDTTARPNSDFDWRFILRQCESLWGSTIKNLLTQQQQALSKKKQVEAF